MKLKKFLGFGIAFATASLATVAVQAATYKAVSEVSADKKTVTMTVNVSDADAVNGYAVQLSYDPTVLEPVASETNDATGSTCYATTAISNDSGVLVADLVDTDSDDKNDAVAIGWAAAEAIAVGENGADVATVTFNVLKEENTEVDVDMVAYATDANTLVDAGDVDVANGTVTFTADFLRGDVNGNGEIEITDATEIYNHLAKTELITDSEKIKRADVDANGEIDITDATAIFNHLAKTNLIEQ